MATRRQFKMIEAGGGGTTIVHGIVTADLGCGYYTIEKATFNPPAYGGENACDEVCTMLDPSPVTCGDLLLVYPDSQLAGTGVYVTARDVASQMIPLVIPSDCLMANLGDEDDGGAIWQVVRGLHEHAVAYKEEWDCCDGEGETGVETLISRQALVLIGKWCEPVTCGTCAVP